MEAFNDFFQAVYIINLDGRFDRWETIKKELHQYGFDKFERVSGCKLDLSNISPHDYSHFNYGPDYLKCRFEKHLIGSIGCLQSHIKVLDKAISLGLENYLVFEDDALLVPGTQDKLNKSIASLKKQDNWDMFYLGGRHRSKRKPVQVAHGLDKIRCTYETHAYSVNKSFYEELRSKLYSCKSEIDYFYAEKIHEQYDAFCCKPIVSIQSDSPSDIATQRDNMSNVGTIRKIKKLMLEFRS